MTSPAAAAMRAELQAAIDKLKPQIRGLHNRARLDMSPGLSAAYAAEIGDHERRRDLCQTVLNALTVLEDDDYPDMPKHDLSADLIAELQRIETDDAAADSEFEPEPVASAGTFAFPAEVPKA